MNSIHSVQNDSAEWGYVCMLIIEESSRLNDWLLNYVLRFNGQGGNFASLQKHFNNHNSSLGSSSRKHNTLFCLWKAWSECEGLSLKGIEAEKKDGPFNWQPINKRASISNIPVSKMSTVSLMTIVQARYLQTACGDELASKIPTL